MENIVRLFESIKNTSSLNDKKVIITANKDNELFKKCLKFLLDGNITTGISDRKIKKLMHYYSVDVPANFEDMMTYIAKNNSGRDVDVAICQIFIGKQPEEFRDFYTQMLTKKYKIGCDSKVINKCIPNLIPTFDVMLGTPIEKCKLKGDEWIAISRKLNGTRCAWIGNKFMTRQGKEYKGLDHIAKDLVELGFGDTFLDGELLYKNKEGVTDSEAFQKGMGIAMSKDGDKSQLKFVVFDMLPIEEFWRGESEEIYSERMFEIEDLENAFANTENLEVVQMVYAGNDHSQIWRWLDHAEEHDWEGVMLNLNTPYECKRSKNLIKVKKFFSCDIFCTGYEEGSGRNKGKLGALICDYKGFPLKVGSGFSDEQRINYWENREDLAGHIVTVKYKEETKNKDGGLSVQFPVFEGFRFDKDEPSYN